MTTPSLKTNTQRIIQRTCAATVDSATARTTVANAASGAALQRFPPGCAATADSATEKTIAASAANGAAARRFPRTCATTVVSATAKTTAANAANGRREINAPINREDVFRMQNESGGV